MKSMCHVQPCHANTYTKHATNTHAPSKYVTISHTNCINEHTTNMQISHANTHTEHAKNMQCMHTTYTKQQTSKSETHNHSCNQRNINIRNNQSHMHTQMLSANTHAAHVCKNISHAYFLCVHLHS